MGLVEELNNFRHQAFEQWKAEVIREIHEQREEILKAFIAKYKCGPDEVRQVQTTMPDGSWAWEVQKKENI